MNRDALKTLGAIVLIAIIVVATFLYGNQQRQAQLRHDQQVKQDQQKTAAVSTTQPTPTTAPTATPDTSNNGTAPVQKPTQDNLQSPSTGSVGGVGGGTLPQSTPSTGGELGYVLPLAALVGLLTWHRHQKQLVLDALRSK